MPCASLDCFILKTPVGTTEDSIAQESERRAVAEFEPRDLQPYTNEDLLKQQIDKQRADKESPDLLVFASSMVSFTKERDFEAAKKRGQQTQFMENFFDNLLKLDQRLLIADPAAYYAPEKTSRLSFILDGLYRLQPQPTNPIAVAVLPVYEGTGFDYDKLKVFWNANQQSSLQFYQFEDDDCKAEYTEDDNLESLNHLCFILFEYLLETAEKPQGAAPKAEEEEDEIEVLLKPVAFSVAPTRTVLHYMAGSFQFPILYCEFGKPEMQMVRDYYFWEIQHALREKVQQKAVPINDASMVLRIVPEELSGVFNEVADTFMMNTMFLLNETSSKAAFTQRRLEAADEFEPKVGEITPPGLVGLQIIEAIENYIQEELRIDPPLDPSRSDNDKESVSKKSKA